MSAKEQQEIVESQKTQVTRREQDQGAKQEYFVPTVDVSETPKELVLRYDMPGVKKSNVEITIDQGTLSVVGHAEPEETGTPMYRETRIGDYKREFSLPEDIDSSRVSATMNAGVLTLHISKPEKVQPKRIQITGT